MREDEARELVAALQRCHDSEPSNSFDRAARDAVEGFWAEQAADGEWEVVLHWRQGPRAYGQRIRHLADAVIYRDGTPANAAADLWDFSIVEPHGELHLRDSTGRFWWEPEGDTAPHDVPVWTPPAPDGPGEAFFASPITDD